MKIALWLLSFFLCFPFLANASVAALGPLDPKYLWMDAQIEQEFSPFSSGITREMLNETQALCPLYCRYKIEHSRVYGPEGNIRRMLEELVRLYPVPNVEFLYLQSDGVIKVQNHWKVRLTDTHFHPEVFPGPVFTSTKDKRCDRAILFMEWNLDLNGTHPSNWPVLSNLVMTLAGQIPWEQKIPQLFWRGYPMGFQHDYSLHGWKSTPRGKACYLSHVYPHLINAGFYVNDHTFIRDAKKREKIDIFKPWISQEDVMKYKYQISIDGHTCSYPGLQWKLLSKCTVFLQQTNDIMWFYSQIQPWVHYIPVNEDLSDLVEKILWAQSHDEECRKIASNSHQFAKEQLSADVICLYCYKVLQKYASLQRF